MCIDGCDRLPDYSAACEFSFPLSINFLYIIYYIRCIVNWIGSIYGAVHVVWKVLLNTKIFREYN